MIITAFPHKISTIRLPIEYPPVLKPIALYRV
jgi:hypothetical protein